MDKKYTILVIEDNALLLDALEYILMHAGYHILTAREGLEAVKIFRENRPDLAVINPAVKGLRQATLYQEFIKSSGVFAVPMVILPPPGFTRKEDFSPDHIVIQPPVQDQKLIAGVKKLLDLTYDFKNGGAGKKVFLAVEHQDVLKVILEQMQKLGWKTETVVSGLYVISQVVRFKPDLIILDLELSEFRSQDSIRILRTFPLFAKIPMILLTSFHISRPGVEDLYQKTAEIEVLRKQCLNAGATEYIGKFNENSFLKLIKSYIH